MFLSVYDTVVLDRRTVGPASFQARLARLLDRLAVGASDLALLDTTAQVDFATEELGLAAGKLAAVPVGAEPWHFPDDPPPEGGPTRSCSTAPSSPSTAPRRWPGRSVSSRAKTSPSPLSARARTGPHSTGRWPGSTETVHDRVSYEHLGRLAAGHHVVLGLFGDSGKARRVVPGKVYQAACAARAVVTADTPAVRAAFDPDEVVLVPPGDPAALATALRGLIKDRARVVELGHGPGPASSATTPLRLSGRGWSSCCGRGTRLSGCGRPASCSGWTWSAGCCPGCPGTSRRSRSALVRGRCWRSWPAVGSARSWGSTSPRLRPAWPLTGWRASRPSLVPRSFGLPSMRSTQRRPGSALLAFEVLEHLEDDRGFLAGLRLARPGRPHARLGAGAPAPLLGG